MENDERTQQQMFEEEMEDLKKELEHFQHEKERVRNIIGKIGGVPTFNVKLFNTVFIAVLIITLVISAFGGRETRLLMIEIATAALAVKILYLMHFQAKVNHFQLWILSGIEWRINEIIKKLRNIQKNQHSTQQ